MVGEIAGVKQNYLSAAESAKVFAAAGMTSTEALLGVEGAMVRTTDSGGFLSRMMRHLVGLFDSLARGQRGQAMSSIGAGLRDAGLGVTTLATSMGGLVALMGTAAVLRGAENMGKWATETMANASAVGMSVEQYSLLQGVLKEVGLKGDEADATLRRLAVNLSTALADPASKSAEAFHNLGITQEMLTRNGTNVYGALRLLADAYARTANDANKAAIMNELLGRSNEKLIPAIQHGSSWLDKFTDKIKEQGDYIDAKGARTLQHLGETVTALAGKISGDAIRAFIDWAPAIETVIDVLGELIHVAAKGADAIAKLVSVWPTDLGNKIADLASGTSAAQAHTTIAATSRTGIVLPPTTNTLATSVISSRMGAGAISTIPGVSGGTTTLPSSLIPPTPGAALAQVPPLSKPEKQGYEPEFTPSDTIMRRQMQDAALAASQGGGTAAQMRQREAQAEIATMQQSLATASRTAKEKEALAGEIAQKQTQLNNEMASSSATASHKSYETFAADEKLAITNAQGNISTIVAVYDDWLAKMKSIYHQDEAEFAKVQKEKAAAVNAAMASQLKAAETSRTQEEKLLSLNTQLASIAAGTMKYQGQEKQVGPSEDIQQSHQALAQAEQVMSRAKSDIADWQNIMAGAAQGSDTFKSAEQEIMNIRIQSETEAVELYKKAGDAAVAAANKIMQPFKQLFDQIGSQFESFSSTLLDSIISPQVDLLKQGLTTIKVSMQSTEIAQAFRNLLLGGINDATKSVETAFSSMIANALSGG